MFLLPKREKILIYVERRGLKVLSQNSKSLSDYSFPETYFNNLEVANFGDLKKDLITKFLPRISSRADVFFVISQDLIFEQTISASKKEVAAAVMPFLDKIPVDASKVITHVYSLEETTFLMGVIKDILVLLKEVFIENKYKVVGFIPEKVVLFAFKCTTVTTQSCSENIYKSISQFKSLSLNIDTVKN